ncbi:MAG: phosphonomutase-like enzyme [Rhodospirillales bacterium]|jgi:2-methylisocitrate lyase-like PEP mutase family enzyme|nr:phosphonomutase-like enzyme [Rhodospirillales bacterium]
MPNAEQIRQAETLRRLHRAPPLLLLPNAWDGASARIVEDAGFAAIATTSGGVAWSLGYRDGETAPWEEIVAATARIVRAVGVPVTADIEAGYATTSEALMRHVADIVEAGAVGINLEDGMPEDGMRVRSTAAAVERIAVARETGRRLGVPIVINARTDLYLRNEGDDAARFAETVARGKAYLAAGADCIFPIGLSDPAVIGDFVAAVKGPVNVMGRKGMPDVAMLEKLGVARVSTATFLTLATMGLTRQLVEGLRDSRSFDGLGATMSYPDAQRLFSR